MGHGNSGLLGFGVAFDFVQIGLCDDLGANPAGVISMDSVFIDGFVVTDLDCIRENGSAGIAEDFLKSCQIAPDEGGGQACGAGVFSEEQQATGK